MASPARLRKVMRPCGSTVSSPEARGLQVVVGVPLQVHATLPEQPVSREQILDELVAAAQEEGQLNVYTSNTNMEDLIDGFTDTTWHLGGTNYRGWQLVGQYAIDGRAVLGLRLTSSRNLDDGVRTVNATTGAVESSFSNAPLKIDVLQLDLDTRF